MEDENTLKQLKKKNPNLGHYYFNYVKQYMFDLTLLRDILPENMNINYDRPVLGVGNFITTSDDDHCYIFVNKYSGQMVVYEFSKNIQSSFIDKFPDYVLLSEQPFSFYDYKDNGKNLPIVTLGPLKIGIEINTPGIAFKNKLEYQEEIDQLITLRKELIAEVKQVKNQTLEYLGVNSVYDLPETCLAEFQNQYNTRFNIKLWVTIIASGLAGSWLLSYIWYLLLI